MTEQPVTVYEVHQPPPPPVPERPTKWWCLEVLNSHRIDGEWLLYTFPTEERAKNMGNYYRNNGKSVGRIFFVELPPEVKP